MCDSMHSKKKGEIKEKVFLSFSLGTFQRNAKKKKNCLSQIHLLLYINMYIILNTILK